VALSKQSFQFENLVFTNQSKKNRIHETSHEKNQQDKY